MSDERQLALGLIQVLPYAKSGLPGSLFLRNTACSVGRYLPFKILSRAEYAQYRRPHCGGFHDIDTVEAYDLSLSSDFRISNQPLSLRAGILGLLGH